MPKNVKQLWSLMGGLIYYRRFLKDMAKRIKPITHLLKKGAPFAFTSDMETTVLSLLTELAEPPILCFLAGTLLRTVHALYACAVMPALTV